MRLLFIGDIVGKPGRRMIQYHLPKIRQKYNIDVVVANYENVSHGFGMSQKNYQEMRNSGIDIFTGGNHSFDKKEIIELMQTEPILRPINMYEETAGSGVFVDEKHKLAVFSAMGMFGMPIFENPFRVLLKEVKKYQDYNIFIDFHAETTAEKRALFLLLKDHIAALVGTHTHIGTDDLMIERAGYLSDIGLSGCYDNVIGMNEKEAIQRFLSGFSKKFDINDKCKKIFQAVVFDIEHNSCYDAFKLKAYDFQEEFISMRARKL
ncbi:MAG: YmdB family metallophosphoesterase [Epsilonproteobacteria bacterium]|nr:YmdB family metallophosphoesterase [Campylobacterota bacterium]